MEPGQDEHQRHITRVIRQMSNLLIVLSLTVVVLAFCLIFKNYMPKSSGVQSVQAVSAPVSVEVAPVAKTESAPVYWIAPDTSTLAQESDADKIRYGRNLIAQTALYFGPNGTIRRNATNGMNCQNCHLDAGTRVFGNNYGSVASTYPKYRARSGGIENVFKRVNDCFERSLNGLPLDTNSTEMTAIVSYINWLGKDIPKGEKAPGSGFKDLAFLDRAADPEKGRVAFVLKCTKCHMADGKGKLNPDQTTYQYPPLWGEHSYNIGAGLFRVSNFAKYIKYNMPWGTTYQNPQLSDEEAWDIAAFVNSQLRPRKDLSHDWPKISEKPFDNPFGPYVDKYNEKRHKYGPYADLAKPASPGKH